MARTVADAMSHHPLTVQPDTSLKEVIKLLADRRVSGLPVTDQTGQLLGIISETDLMWQETGATPPAYIMVLDSVIYLENPSRYERDLHKVLGQTVADVMSREVITTQPDKPLQIAARLMHEKHVRRLPVLDDQGQVVGILTRGDVIRAMATEQEAS